MNTETAFITNIRKALGKEGPLPAARNLPTSDYSARDLDAVLQKINDRTAEDFAALAGIFCDNAVTLNLKTHLAATTEEAAEVILNIIATTSPEFHTVKQVILHDHQDLAAMQLWKRLSGTDVAVHTTFTDDTDTLEKTLASYIGITVPDIGVAEGAAVLHMTKSGEPRSTSLIPSIHIAVLRRDKLVANLDEAFALLEAEKRLPDSMVFISGPSKTADIEAHLVHGAHGPREMHVIITG